MTKLEDCAVWPADHVIATCGPHTGHVVSSLAFCEDAETAVFFASAPKLLSALRKTLAVVRLQNGNIHDDINAIIAEAEAAIAAAEAKAA